MTTGSNSANMTPEEKLAQKLKTDNIGSLMDDDMLSDLSKKAIELAFFQPRVVKGCSSWDDEKLPPLIVTLATEAFKDKIKSVATPIIEELAKTDEFKQLLGQAILTQIPLVARQHAVEATSTALMGYTEALMNQLQRTIGDRLGVDIQTGGAR